MLKEIKREAAKVKQAVHRHGVIHLYRGDDGRCYPVPGYSVELIGVYREPVKQADIEEDLSFQQEERT